MAEASYAKELLATHAAGYINAAGTTVVGFGCALTRIATGHFALLLDASAGVVDDESYTQVAVKFAGVALPVVQDVSNVEKRIRVFDQTGAAVASDIEVKLYKSLTRR